MKTSSIHQKGRLIFIPAVFFLTISVAICVYIALMVSRISEYSQINDRLGKLQITVNQATISIKEFLLNAYTDEKFVKTGSNPSYEDFNLQIKHAKSLIIFLQKSNNTILRTNLAEVQKMTISLDKYSKNLNQLADLYKEKGFKDLGLEGKMREAVHSIENFLPTVNKEYLLTLRRHEKDFLLRKDEKYLEKFDKELSKLSSWISNNNQYTSVQKADLASLLNSYKSSFDSIVTIEKQIGLSPNSGIRHEINANYKEFSASLFVVSSILRNEQEQLSSNAWLLNLSLITLFAILISAVIWSVVYFSKEIAKPIEQLNEAANEISSGHLSIDMSEIKSKKMVSDIVISYEKLIDKLRETITQIEQIASRKITKNIPLHSEKDEIGTSLNKIILQISAYDEAESQRQWSTEGLTKFSEIIRNAISLEQLSQNITQQLVKYTGANQAGLFLVEENFLELKAAYAYERKKYLEKRIELGEGLIGQCFFEKDIIFLTDVPSDYIQITSGLGLATPRCILIAPFIINDTIEGVFEIASFEIFEDYKIDFIKKVGEMVAASISAIRMTSRTKELLQSSLSQTEILKSQEEEMRQNMEELAATQEELQRNQVDYLNKISNLENELKEVKEHKRAVSEHLNSEANKHPLRNPDHNKAYSRRIEYFLDN